MRFSRKLLTILGIFSLVVGLSACGAGKPANTDASLVLKTYTVPDGRAKDLSRTLNRVLSMGSGKNETGKTWFSGSRQILVLAPQRMQDSIASSIKEMANQNSTAAKPPQPVRLDAWIVDARHGTGAADPSLQAIQPALTAFAKAMGPTHFEQAHYLTAVSDTGSQTIISPMPAHVLGYTVKRTDGGLVLNFNYRNGGRGLQGQVTTQLGQILVLGLISDQPAGGHAKGPAVPRLLVVRVTPATQS